MKQKPCDQYKEIIEQYTCDELSNDNAKRLQEHMHQCQGCRNYCEGLEEQEADIKQWVRSLEPSIQQGREQVLQQFRVLPHQSNPLRQTMWPQRWTRYAAAASILILVGFLTGHAFKPSVDIDRLQQQWAAAIQPQMEDRITTAVVNSLQADIVGEYSKLQSVLSEQLTAELQAYAEQTVIRNDLQTYRLLTELIDAIETAQEQDRQWALTAISELEKQRLMDNQQVRKDLAALVVYTDNELNRTRQELENLTTKEN